MFKNEYGIILVFDGGILKETRLLNNHLLIALVARYG